MQTLQVFAAVVLSSGAVTAAPVPQPPATLSAAAADTTLARRLAAIPAELRLAGDRLHVINLYKLQAEALHAASGQPADSAIDRMVATVYTPYSAFWHGYLGDEAAFRRWAVKLLASDHPIHHRLAPLLDVALDQRFVEAVDWLERNAGRSPVGTWYVVFGPGWTDMGGLSGIGMVADFTRMEPDSAALASILPHELTHQVHGTAATRAADPDAGTVLERIVAEGFASYVSWVHGGHQRTAAQALGYTEAEWEAALANEPALAAAAAAILDSRDRADLDRVASRSEQLVPGAPGAAGYFLGFRLVERYVARHGPESWKRIYDLPVRAVLDGGR